MKLETLNYIHELLIDKEKVTLKTKHLVYEARNKAQDEGLDNYKDLCELYEKVRESWDKAHEALIDFEKHDWR